MVNKNGDKVLRVHLDRTFYLVIDGTTAQAVPVPPGGAIVPYVRDFDIPPNETQYTVGCTKWFDAKNANSYLIAYSAEINFVPFLFERPKPANPPRANPPPGIPPPAIPPVKPIK
jgi:hypothetical protein